MIVAGFGFRSGAEGARPHGFALGQLPIGAADCPCRDAETRGLFIAGTTRCCVAGPRRVFRTTAGPESRHSDRAAARDAMIVAGFGFRSGADVDSLRAALALLDIAPDLLATAAGKAGDAPIAGLARALGLPVIAVAAAHLRAQPVVTHSAASQAHYGTGSLAEAAALAAAGPGARLLAARIISPDRLATCAIATGDAT